MTGERHARDLRKIDHSARSRAGKEDGMHPEGFYGVRYDDCDGIAYCKHSPVRDDVYETWSILFLRNFPGLSGKHPALATIVIRDERDWLSPSLEILAPILAPSTPASGPRMEIA